MAGKPKSAEMHPGPGFRIRHEIERPSPETVAGFGRVRHARDLRPDEPALHDAAGDPHRSPTRTCGSSARPAPSRCYPGDNLMVHKALDIAQPGDVIVIDTAASPDERRARRPRLDEGPPPRRRRLRRRRPDPRPAGHPRARRLPGLRARRHPDRPAAPRARARSTSRSAAGGIVVQPGDVIVGDLERRRGRARRTIADELLERLRNRAAGRPTTPPPSRRGEFDNSWVDTLLHSNGVETRDRRRRSRPPRCSSRARPGDRPRSEPSPPADPAGRERHRRLRRAQPWPRRASHVTALGHARARCSTRAPAHRFVELGAKHGVQER